MLWWTVCFPYQYYATYGHFNPVLTSRWSGLPFSHIVILNGIVLEHWYRSSLRQKVFTYGWTNDVWNHLIPSKLAILYIPSLFQRVTIFVNRFTLVPVGFIWNSISSIWLWIYVTWALISPSSCSEQLICRLIRLVFMWQKLGKLPVPHTGFFLVWLNYHQIRTCGSSTGQSRGEFSDSCFYLLSCNLATYWYPALHWPAYKLLSAETSEEAECLLIAQAASLTLSQDVWLIVAVWTFLSLQKFAIFFLGFHSVS